MLGGEVARLCRELGIDFDHRALLEHLLDSADYRTGVVDAVSLTSLAGDLGYGPSGRRTLKRRLNGLVGLGVLRWMPSRPGAPTGAVELPTYRQLVHHGSDDPRRGFVQVVPSALASLSRRHRLSADARALLRRLLVEAPTAVLSGSGPALAARLALGLHRLQPALDELVAASVVAWATESELHVIASPALVRRPTPVPPARERAVSPAQRADIPPSARGLGDHDSALDSEVDLSPPSPPKPPVRTAPASRGWGLLAQFEANLSEPQRAALHELVDRARLAQLAQELDRLLGGGWEPAALVAHVGAPLPGAWRSPARILWARAQGLPTMPPDVEAVRAEADATRLAAQVEAARSQARSHAAVEFLDAGEIVVTLAKAYSGAALEAGLAVLAACRPDEQVQAVSDAATAEIDDETDRGGRAHSRRRTQPSSPGPAALGRLLSTGAVPPEGQAS